MDGCKAGLRIAYSNQKWRKNEARKFEKKCKCVIGLSYLEKKELPEPVGLHRWWDPTQCEEGSQPVPANH